MVSTERNFNFDDQGLNVNWLFDAITDPVPNGVIECANATDRDQFDPVTRREQLGEVGPPLRGDVIEVQHRNRRSMLSGQAHRNRPRPGDADFAGELPNCPAE